MERSCEYNGYVQDEEKQYVGAVKLQFSHVDRVTDDAIHLIQMIFFCCFYSFQPNLPVQWYFILRSATKINYVK